MEAAVAWPDSELNDVVGDIAHLTQHLKGVGQVAVEVGFTKFEVPFGARAKDVKYAQFIHLRRLMNRRSGEERRQSEATIEADRRIEQRRQEERRSSH